MRPEALDSRGYWTSRRSLNSPSSVLPVCHRPQLMTTISQMRESSTPLLFPIGPVVEPADVELTEEIEKCMAALLLQILESESKKEDDDDS